MNAAARGQGTVPGPGGPAGGYGHGLVVAVDGPAGSGKSSAARGVASVLGLRYLDTGAMYRALTWWLLAEKADVASPAEVAGLAGRPAISVGIDPQAPSVQVDGRDVAGAIRGRAVSNAVSAVASVPQVRQRLIAMQREIIGSAVSSGPGIVAEGRDIGTVVAPEAQVKVFLTASEDVRAARRAADLAADPAATPSLTMREIARRDRSDAAQTTMAADAVLIDATSLPLDEVIAQIVGLARASRAGARTG